MNKHAGRKLNFFYGIMFNCISNFAIKISNNFRKFFQNTLNTSNGILCCKKKKLINQIKYSALIAIFHIRNRLQIILYFANRKSLITFWKFFQDTLNINEDIEDFFSSIIQLHFYTRQWISKIFFTSEVSQSDRVLPYFPITLQLTASDNPYNYTWSILPLGSI